MHLEHAIADFEACTTLQELRDALQRVAEAYGFSGFNFLDTGQPHLDRPYYLGTSGRAWEEDYASNGFVHVDPCLDKARHTNTPFSWSGVPVPAYKSGRKPGALKTMEAARDHGFTEGLVVPYHFRDHLGRTFSSLVVFFWKDKVSRYGFMLKHSIFDLHLLVIYWSQRAVDIVATTQRQTAPVVKPDSSLPSEVTLTDREREVVAWASRGKTGADTAEILKISEDTVDTHMRAAMRKLLATNKTHAVAKAIYLGLI